MPERRPPQPDPDRRAAGHSRLPGADAATVAKIRAFMAADRDLPPTKPRMRYLVLSQPRTGGTFLCEALQRSGAAGLPFEYLNPAAMVAFAKRLGATSGMSFPRLIAELEGRRTGANGVFGLHLHFEQLSKPLKTPEAAYRWMQRFDRIVFLYRRDKLAQAVSLYKSVQSTVWHRDAHEAGERLPERWAFDPVAIARHVWVLAEQEAGVRKTIAQLAMPRLELSYEELDTGFEESWRRVSEFLDLPPMPSGQVYPSLARMRDAVSDTMIERFLAALRDSDLARDETFGTVMGRR